MGLNDDANAPFLSTLYFQFHKMAIDQQHMAWEFSIPDDLRLSIFHMLYPLGVIVGEVDFS